MSPTVTCGKCGRSREVRPDGRGFPSDIAKRALRKECEAAGCKGDPQYQAGLVTGPRPCGQEQAVPQQPTSRP
jgi:hypothetical protein